MHAMPQPGSMIGGRYRVDAALGQGGMGAIFAATNVATGRAVAIKLLLPSQALDPAALERFLIEARATSRIEHPNVISVFDVGGEQGMPFLVMERLRGESLGERLRRGRLSVLDALDILIPACRGLAEAHREGVVHRDLKPDNIFLCQGKDGSNRAPKVLDFGVSKLYEDPHGRSITQTGISMGTPEYMCPEQIDSPRAVDPLFDVYGMGVVLYQTLTGRLPYQADNLYQLVQQIGAGRPTPMRALNGEIPPELEAVVMRAMSPQREKRQQSMHELAAELEQIRARLSSAPAAPSYPPHTGPAAFGPQGYIPYGPPSSQPAYTPPPAYVPPKRGSGLLIGGILGGLALALCLVGAVGFVVWKSVGRSGRSAASASSDDPLRPLVDLRFSGQCRPRFDRGILSVTANNEGINVSAVEGSTIHGTLTIVPGGESLRGTINLDTAHFQRTQMQVGVMMEGQRQFWNWRSYTSVLGADPITGSITFAEWDPAHGVMDARFDDVTLQEQLTGALCRVEGRVRTTGLTWGGGR